MLIKANGPLKIYVAAGMLLRTNKKEKKRGHSLKEFFIKETQSYEYIFCIVCKNRQDVGFHCFIAFLDFSRLSDCFVSLGTSAHIFGPRNLRLSVPLKTKSTKGISN